MTLTLKKSETPAKRREQQAAEHPPEANSMRRAGRSALGAGSMGALALLGTALAPLCPAAAQGAVSADLPAGVPAVGLSARSTPASAASPAASPPDAAGAVRQLQAGGGVVGYPDGTFGGPRSMTRYELAMAVSRLLPWIAARLASPDRTSVRGSDGASAASVDLTALTEALRDYVAPRQLSQLLRDYAPSGQTYTRAQADRILALHADLVNMMAFLGQLRDQLAAYGVDSNVLDRERRAAESGLAAPSRLQISGEASVSVKASAEYSGGSHGQTSAGVDQDGALLDDGSPSGPGSPDFAGPRGNGKRGLLSDPSVLYDTQIALRYNPSADAAVVAQFIMGSYWGAWREQQAYSAAFGTAALGLLSNRSPADLSLEPYLAYLTVPMGAAHRAGGVQTSGATLGRVPTRLTPFTWWAVDPDTALANAREDSGVISLTGAVAAADLPGISLSVFGGYDPADGTAPWTLASPLDPTLNGRIGFGHPIRPGGAQVPGVGVLYGNATRSHLLLNPLTAGRGAPSGLYY
ncbi:MAG: hypothetical protein LC772_00485, partial [Chloroflexi bacterium]|nr:hypothetical protein [Chloroflexota bacterium]